jgi:hypothetical protein
VQRSLGKRVENKFDYNGGQVDISSLLAMSPYFTNLNWTTQQGITQGTRIGNKLTVKNAVLRGSLNMRDYSSLTNSKTMDQLVTLVVFKCKSYLAGTNPTYANTFSRMFQLGASSAGLTNTPVDHIRNFNSDIITVKAVRKFKLGYSGFFTTNNNVVNTQYSANNNDFKYQAFFRIPLTKFYKKTQIWDDNASPVDARNDNLFFMVYCCPADGSAFTSTPISLTWDWEGSYEDA